jgi:hypothetical protein
VTSPQQNQLERINPNFPQSYGVPHAGDNHVISRPTDAIRKGLRWQGAPEVYGSHKMLSNCFVHQSRSAYSTGSSEASLANAQRLSG